MKNTYSSHIDAAFNHYVEKLDKLIQAAKHHPIGRNGFSARIKSCADQVVFYHQALDNVQSYQIGDRSKQAA